MLKCNKIIDSDRSSGQGLPVVVDINDYWQQMLVSVEYVVN